MRTLGHGDGRATATIITMALAAAAAIATLLPASGHAESTEQGLSAVSAASAQERSCFSELAGGDAVDQVSVTAPRLGYFAATLTAEGGDWDLGIFDAASGDSLSGAASSGADELAQAYVTDGQELIVQACRVGGETSEAELRTGIEPIEAEPARQSLVRVATPRQRDRNLLESLGLDLTESAGEDYIDVLLHGATDRRALERAGLDSEPLIRDLAAQSVRDRRADRRFAAQTQASALPSGRTTYRTLADYQQELKDLADENPDLVRPLTLDERTYEGRAVEGIEITTDPKKVRDGKPVFLQMGLHHAREWPSGEHAIEWAYELIQGYRDGDSELKPLVESTRTIVIPVVNPDGFNGSRSAGELNGNGDGQGGDALVNFATSPGEYRRKNCRVGDSETANCTASVGAAENGTDPNRNYGGYWGGPGADDTPQSAIYRGPGPFSEPETRNIRELVSKRAVVTLITNHTFSNLVLRPPGIAILGDSVDEPLYEAFGAEMTAENGYLNQKSFELYDTSGTTEDWTYTATGGLGFTFEIGCNQGDEGASFDPEGDCIGNFHPPYEQMIAEYEGGGPAAENVGGGGNRAAYLAAQQSTANADRHSVIEGKAPAGAVLRVERDVATPTWEGYDDDTDNPGPATLDDSLSSEMKVRGSGNYEFHINPSTSPFVAKDTGRPQVGGPPQAEIAFSGDNTTTTPPVGCADFETEDADCWNDHPFEIDSTSDNEAATVQIEWASPVNDWDMKVFRDTNGDGSSAGEPSSAQIGQSAQGPTTEESTTFVDPQTGEGKLRPGKYVVRVINFAATDPVTAAYTGSISFEGPQPFEPGTTQSWTLTCATDGKVRFSKQIEIERGESRDLNLANRCAKGGGNGGPGGGGNGGPGSGGEPPASCRAKNANLIVGTGKGERLRGTKRSDAIIARGGRDRAIGRAGRDCVYGNGGRDALRGRAGADQLRGGRGKDSIRGNRGRDRISGNGGPDKLRGGGGRDKLKGGRGRDKLHGGRGRDVFRCGRGRDTVLDAGPRDRVARSCERVRRR